MFITVGCNFAYTLQSFIFSEDSVSFLCAKYAIHLKLQCIAAAATRLGSRTLWFVSLNLAITTALLAPEVQERNHFPAHFALVGWFSAIN